jgi:hypothetical protein
MYVRYMPGGTDMLEQLRERLADLEARQRATGGTAEPGFWDLVGAKRQGGTHGESRGGPSGKSRGGPSGGLGGGFGGHGEDAGRPVGGPSVAGSGPAPRRRGRIRRMAPESRPAVPVSGPWAGVSPQVLDSLDPAVVRWTSQVDTADPGWLAATAAQADARAGAARPEGRAGGDAAVPVLAEAVLGMSLHRHQ